MGLTASMCPSPKSDVVFPLLNNIPCKPVKEGHCLRCTEKKTCSEMQFVPKHTGIELRSLNLKLSVFGPPHHIIS